MIKGQIKRYSLLCIFIAVILAVSACSAKEVPDDVVVSESSTAPAATPVPTPIATPVPAVEPTATPIPVEKDLEVVSITLPASFYQDIMSDSSVLNTYVHMENVDVEESGEVSLQITREQYDAMLAQTREDFTVELDTIVRCEDFPSIQKIEPSQDFNEFKVTVDKERYENSFDRFALIGIEVYANFYQILSGVDSQNTVCNILLVDAVSGEIFQ